jgi:hypothetical protein
MFSGGSSETDLLSEERRRIGVAVGNGVYFFAVTIADAAAFTS